MMRIVGDVAPRAAPPQPKHEATHRRALKTASVIAVVLTLVIGPLAYGAGLLVLLPIDAALAALWFVSRRDSLGIVGAIVFGPTLLATRIWFALRFDESLSEAVVAAVLAAASLVILLWLRTTRASPAPAWWSRFATFMASERPHS
jgi:hypothetical protein